MLNSVRSGDRENAKVLIAQMIEDLGPVLEALKIDARQGSVQEREKLNSIYSSQDKVAQEVLKTLCCISFDVGYRWDILRNT